MKDMTSSIGEDSSIRRTARRMAVIGGGPRALGVLERLAANLAVLAADDPIEIHVVDPYPPGPGRIWRYEQSSVLVMNSQACDITVFTDSNTAMEGPTFSGWTFLEWLHAVRDEREHCHEVDAILLEEITTLRRADFPTRRLMSCYLTWAFSYITETMERNHSAKVVVHRDAAIGVEELVDGGLRVSLERSGEIEADIVIACLGNHEPGEGSYRTFLEFSRTNSLSFVPPGLLSENFVERIPSDSAVLVRGFGLTAIDAIALLTEGRGGNFTHDDEGLKYNKSGNEPTIFIGSRRGIPYLPKRIEELKIEVEPNRIFTEASVGAVHGNPTFDDKIWPLISRQLTYSYYKQIFSGKSENLRKEFFELAAILARRSPTREELRIATSYLDVQPLGLLDIEELRRESMASRDPISSSDAETRVYDSIERALARRRHGHRDAIDSMTQTLIQCSSLVSKLEDSGIISSVPEWWGELVSYVVNGPPAYRLSQVLALADAGILRFLGSIPNVNMDEEHHRFRVDRYREIDGNIETVSRYFDSFIDARLSRASIASSSNPFLRSLNALSNTSISDGADGVGSSDHTLRVLAPNGRIWSAENGRSAVFALGPFTSKKSSGQFPRPGVHVPHFAENDECVRSALEHEIYAVK